MEISGPEILGPNHQRILYPLSDRGAHTFENFKADSICVLLCRTDARSLICLDAINSAAITTTSAPLLFHLEL